MDMKASRFHGEHIIGILREYEAGAHLEEAFEVSERRACSVLGVDRDALSRQPPK
jgi:hypothetical protein